MWLASSPRRRTTPIVLPGRISKVAATALETAHLELADAEYQEERIRDVYQDRQNKSSSPPRSSLRPLSSTCRPLPALP